MNKEKLMGSIGFVGGGNMAESLIKGVIEAGIYAPEGVFVSDISEQRLLYISQRYGVCAAKSNAELAGQVEVLVLSVKPQNMKEALESIKDAMNKDVVVVSIAAGIKVSKMTDALGDIAIVRVMPNTPALVGAGASALYANSMMKV
jgi:pyrroline-5-carboxylate reductase